MPRIISIEARSYLDQDNVMDLAHFSQQRGFWQVDYGSNGSVDELRVGDQTIPLTVPDPQNNGQTVYNIPRRLFNNNQNPGNPVLTQQEGLGHIYRYNDGTSVWLRPGETQIFTVTRPANNNGQQTTATIFQNGRFYSLNHNLDRQDDEVVVGDRTYPIPQNNEP